VLSLEPITSQAAAVAGLPKGVNTDRDMSEQPSNRSNGERERNPMRSTAHMTTATEIVSAITSHHAELQASLSARVDAVVTAARGGGSYDETVAALGLLLATDIVPHARAEEDVLYGAATDPSLRALVAGMIFEHETLFALAAELPSASTAVDAAGVARAIREVFIGHVRRENELLLPALAEDPDTDLPRLLPVMQDRFAAHRAAASS
jgi:hypothetical protein